MATLTKDVIGYIGKFLSYKDRINCQLASKVFCNIHETFVYHEFKCTPENYQYKLGGSFDYLLKIKPILNNISITFEGFNGNTTFSLPNGKIDIPEQLDLELYFNDTPVPEINKILKTLETHKGNYVMVLESKTSDKLCIPLKHLPTLISLNLTDESLDLLKEDYIKYVCDLKINLSKPNQTIDLQKVRAQTVYIILPDLSATIIHPHKITCLYVADLENEFGSMNLYNSFRDDDEKSMLEDFYIGYFYPLMVHHENNPLYKLIETLPKTMDLFIAPMNDVSIIYFLRKCHNINKNIHIWAYDINQYAETFFIKFYEEKLNYNIYLSDDALLTKTYTSLQEAYDDMDSKLKKGYSRIYKMYQSKNNKILE